jgi:hypothetical protein
VGIEQVSPLLKVEIEATPSNVGTRRANSA